MEPLVTVGQQLKSKREELGLSIEIVASQTYIQKSTLEELESDTFDKIIGEVYIKGFLSQYADVLKLDSKKIIALYRDQVDQSNSIESTDQQLPEPIQTKSKTLPIFISICILSTIIALVLLFVPGEQINTIRKPTTESTKVIEQLPVQTTDKTNDEVRSPQEPATLPNNEVPDNEISDSNWPALPATGATIKLQAQSSSILEATIDDLPTVRYNLISGSKIEWNPIHSAHFYLVKKGALNISLNNSPLDFNILGIIDLTQE